MAVVIVVVKLVGIRKANIYQSDTAYHMLCIYYFYTSQQFYEVSVMCHIFTRRIQAHIYQIRNLIRIPKSGFPVSVMMSLNTSNQALRRKLDQK